MHCCNTHLKYQYPSMCVYYPTLITIFSSLPKQESARMHLNTYMSKCAIDTVLSWVKTHRNQYLRVSFYVCTLFYVEQYIKYTDQKRNGQVQICNKHSTFLSHKSQKAIYFQQESTNNVLSCHTPVENLLLVLLLSCLTITSVTSTPENKSQESRSEPRGNKKPGNSNFLVCSLYSLVSVCVQYD